MIRILLIGEDPAILRQRAGMLEQPGVEVTTCLTEDFDDARSAHSLFDLVILCHTIDPHVKAAMLTAEIFRQWRHTPVLRMVKGSGDSAAQCGADANFVIGDPGEVVDMALRMLGTAPVQSAPASSERERTLQAA